MSRLSNRELGELVDKYEDAVKDDAYDAIEHAEGCGVGVFSAVYFLGAQCDFTEEDMNRILKHIWVKAEDVVVEQESKRRLNEEAHEVDQVELERLIKELEQFRKP